MRSICSISLILPHPWLYWFIYFNKTYVGLHHWTQPPSVYRICKTDLIRFPSGQFFLLVGIMSKRSPRIDLKKVYQCPNVKMEDIQCGTSKLSVSPLQLFSHTEVGVLIDHNKPGVNLPGLWDVHEAMCLKMLRDWPWNHRLAGTSRHAHPRSMVQPTEGRKRTESEHRAVCSLLVWGSLLSSM